MALFMRPDFWAKSEGIVILDPDGWRDDNKPWDEPIGFEEWQVRRNKSTIMFVGQEEDEATKWQ